MGFSRAGFEIRAAVEIDPAACATLRRNWPAHEIRLVEKPLEEVSTGELLRVAGLGVGEAGIVIGGPPCQSWCIAGNRLGFDDPRGLALLEFCRVVREAQPAVFCLENVPGLMSYKGGDIVAAISAAINDGTGETYDMSAEILNAAEFGVAQHRRRVFVVGWRVHGEFYFPPPTHELSDAASRPWPERTC